LNSTISHGLGDQPHNSVVKRLHRQRHPKHPGIINRGPPLRTVVENKPTAWGGITSPLAGAMLSSSLTYRMARTVIMLITC